MMKKIFSFPLKRSLDLFTLQEESECELPMTLETSEEPSVEGTRFQKYLYIQMEYCEKSTLRNVIDEGLYKNPSRMWRLFREIVEGLSHVHSQVFLLLYTYYSLKFTFITLIVNQ